jgi:hypothetical protein
MQLKNILTIYTLCHSSRGQSLASHHGSPGLISVQVMWDLWWTCDSEVGFLRVLRLLASVRIPPIRILRLLVTETLTE